MTKRTNITKNNFFAWSLYTAYTNPITIGNWVAAAWPGKPINSAADLKADIDFRIQTLLGAFGQAEFAPNKAPNWVRYFVVPEFYFHSAHGPYPHMEINGQSPFAYLTEQLGLKLLATLRQSTENNKDWVICTGSVLTTHVTDIAAFGQRPQVQERLKELNGAHQKAMKAGAKPIATENIGLVRTKALDEAHLDVTDPYYELNATVNAMRQDPLCTVRNRACIFIYHGENGGSMETRVIEKQAESTVDLTLGVLNQGALETGGQITEWMANYPPVSIINGDHQHAYAPNSTIPPSPGARMSITSYNQPVELGAEICLDHRLQRLRRTVDMKGNPPIDIQLIPSGGMQILDYGVAAGSSGAIFNADGCAYILNEYNASGVPVITENGKPSSGTAKEVITGVYTSAAQTKSTANGVDYFSHSQLSYRTTENGPDGYSNPLSTANPGGVTYTGSATSPANQYLDAYKPPIIIPVTSKSTDIGTYFAAGLGEIHQYSV